MSEVQTLEEKRRLVARLLLDRHRQRFPTLEQLTYLNFGVQGTLPTPAREAIDRSLRRLDALAPYSTDAILERRQEMARARATLAEELGIEARCLALVENTSVGMNIVLWGLPWKPGDRIVITNHEYPGVLAVVDELARRFDLQVAEWDVDGDAVSDRQRLERLEPLLAPPTRLLLLSHILWDTGRVLPLAALAGLCRSVPKEPVPVLVDGAQAVGVLPLDLAATGVDYYAFTGHKWWCGPEGAGGLYVHPRALPRLRSTFLGPRSLVFDGERGFGDLREDADRFEVSSACVALHTALTVAIETHRSWGDGRARQDRQRQLAASLWRGLADLEAAGVERLQGEAPETGLVFFRVAGRAPLEIVRFLEARGVLIRTIPHAACLRVSIHYLTLPEEIDRLLATLRELLERPAAQG
jgi:L-cysteine/cystine lyase